MKFLLLSLITHQPDPVTGELLSPSDRLREVVDTAVLAEQLGFEGFAVGERHEHPFLSSSPPVVLSNIAARTSNIELWTGVTTLSLLDPVRAYEDYATLDNLSGGRLQLIIGKGNGTAQADLFHVTPDDQWDRNREGYELFRLLWENERVTWEGSFRPSLTDAVTVPRPLQPRLTMWHGSATSRESVDAAAQYGDPVFSANVTNPIEPYAELIEYYRDRWAAYGHDPRMHGWERARRDCTSRRRHRKQSSGSGRCSSSGSSSRGARGCRWSSRVSRTLSNAVPRSSAARSK